MNNVNGYLFLLLLWRWLCIWP